MTDTIKTKYAFANAIRVADYLVKLLAPHCDRIHLAGSLRRIRPDVKDIEIVCMPKKERKEGLLFEEQAELITSRDFTEALATITDIVVKGNVDGRQMQIRTNSKICPGIYLDLFMPRPDDYYRIYTIRTGSAEYSHHIIAGRWKANGWVGTDGGLRKESECIEKSGKWLCIAKKPQLPPVWNSEMEFYAWLGLPYIDPQLREYRPTLNTAQ